MSYLPFLSCRKWKTRILEVPRERRILTASIMELLKMSNTMMHTKQANAVSTWSVRTVYGLPSFLLVGEVGSSSGEADSVSEASPWPGPHSWEERNWAEQSPKRERRGYTSSSKEGRGRGERAEKSLPPLPHSCPA